MATPMLGKRKENESDRLFSHRLSPRWHNGHVNECVVTAWVGVVCVPTAWTLETADSNLTGVYEVARQAKLLYILLRRGMRYMIMML